MTFLHKLARRLAGLKTALIMGAVATIACEIPLATDVSNIVAFLQLSPKTSTLRTNQIAQFVVVGLTSTGDTAKLGVTWSATGGSIVDTGTTGGKYYVHYRAPSQPGQYKVFIQSTIAGPSTQRTAAGLSTQSTAADLSDSAVVTVLTMPVASVSVSPAPASATVGQTVQLTATALDSTGAALSGRVVTWASSNAGVATVSASGFVTGVAVGSATITATSEGRSGTAAVTVTPVPVASVGVTPAAVSIAIGQTAQLTATPRDANGNALTGRVVTWASSNTGAATVNASGVVTGAAAGPTTITATSEGRSGTAAFAVTVTPASVASVSVSPASTSVAAGQTVQLSATPHDASGNTLVGRVVTWTSSDAGLATVSGSGLVTGVTAGAVTITATSEGQSGSSAVSVTVPVASVSVTPPTLGRMVGQTGQLTATPRDAAGNPLTGRVVTWTTNSAAVATVNSSGLVTAQGAGSATITATSEGRSGSATITVTLVPVASVTVTPASSNLQEGATVQLTATLRDSVGNVLSGRAVSWVTSNAGVATVSASGLVRAVVAGLATITATSEGKSANATITVQAPPPGSRVGYYVTSTGSSSGTGSASSPWSLSYALGGAAGRIQPGDTVWLRGGTYSGVFTSSLTGTPSAPMILRQYPGERATIMGNLRITGSYGWYWGFEMGSAWGVGAANHVADAGLENKYINLVVHDGQGQGIAMNDANSDGGEAYGNIVYNNGRVPGSPDHGMYVHNPSGAPTKLLRDNIVFNNTAINIQVYVQAFPNYDVHLDGNICFGAAALDDSHSANLFAGGASGMVGIRFTNNFTYERAASLSLGLSAEDGQDVLVSGNVIMGGSNKALNLGPGSSSWQSATVQNNTVYAQGGAIVLVPTSVSGWAWSGNTYYRNATALSWNQGGTALTLANWRSATGLGGTDNNPGTAPGGTQVFVRPNAYEAGRANIIIYNWAGAANVSVDLSTVLNIGQAYTIVNVQDFFGTPVASGIYAGGTVSLPMAGIAPPTPIGRATTTPPVTGPTFQVFVVRLAGT